MTRTTTPRRLAVAIVGLTAVATAAALTALAVPAPSRAAPVYTSFSFNADAKIVSVSGTKVALQVKAWGTSKLFTCLYSSSLSCYRPVHIRIRVYHGFYGKWKFVTERSRTTGSYASAGVTELFNLLPCDQVPQGKSVPFLVEAIGTALTTGVVRTIQKTLRYNSCA